VVSRLRFRTGEPETVKLLIISNMSHYRREGQIVGWGPTAQEIDHLAELFDEIRHIACLHTEPAPSSSLPYEAKNVTLIPVPPAGGVRVRNKLDILRRCPLYFRTIWRGLAWADMVHVRCPANISLIAIVLLAIVRTPRLRWVKYAGNWQPDGPESWSNSLQRWWLNRRLHRGVVTVNGAWANQPGHVHSFLNPCLSDLELSEAKSSRAQKQLSTPIRLLFVGRLETTKGVGRALEVLAELKREGLSATLDLVGDGSERVGFENQARNLQVTHLVRFHGWLPRPLVGPLYAQSHLTLLPTNCSEGWPKVLSEAMAYGVVPVASEVSSIPQYLKKFGIGKVLEPYDVEGFVRAILWYGSHPNEWKTESDNGIRAAELFSYSNYLTAVRQLLKLDFNEIRAQSSAKAFQ
jgi:glycosyltransferase involved in cell wall biosynthesis